MDARESEPTAGKNRATVERKSERELVVSRTVRGPARLVFDADPGPAIVMGLADLGDRFRLVADEIDRLSDAGQSQYGDTAIFYRTNAQSRAFEEVFIRVGMPYTFTASFDTS